MVALRSPESDARARPPDPRRIQAGGEARRAATAQLLGLLRAGEQSAEAAFRRIARRLTAAESAYAWPALEGIADDEARHDHLLAHAASADAAEAVRVPPSVRRFFRRLESREPAVHLVRISALDGCVCQVLSAALTCREAAQPVPAVAAVLSIIRRDEGRHVRIARGLARSLGATPDRFQELGLETRHAFAHVLALYESAWVALGVDTGALRQRVIRDGD